LGNIAPEPESASHLAGVFAFWILLFGLSPLFATLTKQTALCTILEQTTPLDATVTCHPQVLHLKDLQGKLTRLDATLTKNRGYLLQTKYCLSQKKEGANFAPSS
jgi:hypothetical protein